jgi:glycosyltransferase involved in cell wall biosynthesis
MLVTSEFPPDVGGIGSHVAELARGLSSRVESVAVVHPQSLFSRSSEVRTRDYDFHAPKFIKGEPFYQWMLHGWLSREISRSRANLVHVHGVRPLAATRGLSIPTVFTNHSSGFLARLNASESRKRRTAQLLKHVSYVIAPSDELVSAARTFGYSGPAAMIPNGVDIQRFHAGGSSLRQKLGIGADAVVVLLARRLVEKNGVIWFARAVAQLRSKDFRVIVAGDGPERDAMTAILNDAGVSDRVVMLGAVQNTEMPDIYRAADISVLPSLAEATSIAGLEAMATSLPLVGTDVGGIPTILADGETGLLVPPRTPDAMAAALDKLIGNRELRMRLGKAAREKVERQFSWPTIVDRTIDVYGACLGGSSR